MSPRGRLHFFEEEQMFCYCRKPNSDLMTLSLTPNADYSVSAVTVCHGDAN